MRQRTTGKLTFRLFVAGAVDSVEILLQAPNAVAPITPKVVLVKN